MNTHKKLQLKDLLIFWPTILITIAALGAAIAFPDANPNVNALITKVVLFATGAIVTLCVVECINPVNLSRYKKYVVTQNVVFVLMVQISYKYFLSLDTGGVLITPKSVFIISMLVALIASMFISTFATMISQVINDYKNSKLIGGNNNE